MFTENQPFSRTTTNKQILFWSISQGPSTPLEIQRRRLHSQARTLRWNRQLTSIRGQGKWQAVWYWWYKEPHSTEGKQLLCQEGKGSLGPEADCEGGTRVWCWMQKRLVSVGRMRMYKPLAGNAWCSRRPAGLVRWTCRAGTEKEVHEWGLAKLYWPNFPLVHSYYSSATRKWGKHSVTVLMRHLVSFSWSAYE